MHIGNSCKVFCRRATDIMQIACQMCPLVGLRRPKEQKWGMSYFICRNINRPAGGKLFKFVLFRPQGGYCWRDRQRGCVIIFA